jgi:hypothetical protein
LTTTISFVKSGNGLRSALIDLMSIIILVGGQSVPTCWFLTYLKPATTIGYDLLRCPYIILFFLCHDFTLKHRMIVTILLTIDAVWLDVLH